MALFLDLATFLSLVFGRKCRSVACGSQLGFANTVRIDAPIREVTSEGMDGSDREMSGVGGAKC